MEKYDIKMGYLRMKVKHKLVLSNKDISVVLVLIVLCITSWGPFQAGHPIATDFTRRVLNYVVFASALGSIFVIPKIKLGSKLCVVAIVAVVVYRMYNILYAYNYKGLGITSTLLGIMICIQSDEIRAKVFKYYKYFMVVTGAIGIICFIVYVTNLGIPYIDVPRGDGIGWINYRISYLMYDHRTLTGLTRLNGLFEEPGWFGTWAAFYLCADNLNFRKAENLILAIAGLLTFSLAFVLLLIIYYILKNLSDWKNWVWIVVLALFYFMALPNIKTGNVSVDHVLERMVITSEGLVGNNRYGSLFERVWERTLKEGKIIFGYGAGYAHVFGTGEGQGLASIKQYVVDFGIVGTFIIFAPIFIASVREALQEKNKLMLFYIIITYASLYQRPYLFYSPYLIIYLCGLSYTKITASKNVLGQAGKRKSMVAEERYDDKILHNHGYV